MAFMAWSRKPSVRHKTYRVYFHDHAGVLRSIQGFTSKRASDRLGKNLEELSQTVASGGEPHDQLSQWILHQLDDRRKKKLIEWGILQSRYITSGLLLSKHIDAWRDDLMAEGKTDRYYSQEHSRVSVVMCGCCDWQTFSQIDPARLNAELMGLASRRRWSKQTLVHYMKSCKAFTAWMVSRGRAARDPLVVIKPPTVKKTDQVHPRFAMTGQMSDHLIRSTRDSERKAGGMDGTQRALIYRLVIYETGFRADTVRRLRTIDFDLGSEIPTVTGRVKGGRRITIPLSDSIVPALSCHLGGREPQLPAFDCPTVSWFADVLKADLKEAGYSNVQFDRYIDFHALRHTFATMASKVMDPRTLQQIMGHTDIRTTMGFYTHRITADLAVAKTNMPQCAAQCAVDSAPNEDKRRVEWGRKFG